MGYERSYQPPRKEDKSAPPHALAVGAGVIVVVVK